VAGAAAALAGCGDYSNEDLLFMSAVPSSTQLAVVLPAAAPAAMQAELAQDTHNGINNVNGMLDDVLGLIDAIRSYEPTSRTSDSRTWGPFADTNHPGWQWKLTVTRPDDTTFTYELDVGQTATPDAWVSFLTGNFDAVGGVKQGNGTVVANFSNLSAAQFPLDANTQPLQTLTITYQNYQTQGSPVSVALNLTRTPDSNGVTSATFTYEFLTDGSGGINFTLIGNVVPGPAIETVTIESGWLPSGAGQATLAVVSGDGAGLSQTECWDATFEATYNDKPWSTAEDVNLGQMAAFCPVLPTLP
jgi:hypothetical protein